MQKNQIDPLEEELHELCELTFEGRATPSQKSRLEELVQGNSSLLKIYIQRCQEHAALQWNAGVFKGQSQVTPARSSRSDFAQNSRRAHAKWWTISFLAAGCLLTIFAVTLWPFADQTVAQIVTSKNATWGSSDLPTNLGARLTSGVLKLRQGMVTLNFDCGGAINMQGPAELEIVSSSVCRLHAGRITGRMENGKSGLTVLTEKAKLVDLGTEFGVCVDEAGDCRLVVFEGEVECQLTNSNTIGSVVGGMTVRIDDHAIRRIDDAELSHFGVNSPSSPLDTRQIQSVTTSFMRGRDRFIVQNPDIDEFIDDGTMLLVKEPFPGLEGWRRKSYLGFDLTGVPIDKVESVDLCLAIADSRMGFAERCPDAIFAVYGLTDESLDDWDRDKINWDNAPGNASGNGISLDGKKVRRLGQFLVQQGQSSGQVTLSTPELTQFLKKDTNQLATFIIVRQTPELAGSGTAHAFASSRHPTLSPPTLKFFMQPVPINEAQ